MALSTPNTVKSQPPAQQATNNKSSPLLFKQNFGVKTTTPMMLPQAVPAQPIPKVQTPTPTPQPTPEKVQQTPVASVPKPLVSAPTPAPNKGLITFPGLIGSLSNQQNSPYNQINTKSATNLQDLSKSNPATSGLAFDAYTKAVENQRKLKSDIASHYGDIESTPIPLEFQQGREQVLGRQYASQLEAAQNAVLQQQAAIGQQITGTQTQQAGFNQAGGLANTGQGNINTALGNAAGYTQPTVGAYGQTQYSPLEAGQNNGNPYGNGPGAGANVQSVIEQTKAINDLSAARNSANTIVQNQLTPFLAQSGVNPSDFNAINRFLQEIGAQTSSVEYKTFQNIITDLASVFAQVLTPPGGSVTDYQAQIAQSLVDATASGQSVQEVIKALDEQAQSKIGGIQNNVSNLNTGQNVNPSNRAASAGGYNFVQDANGNWVPAN